FYFFFSSRRRHTRSTRDWSSDVCSSDLAEDDPARALRYVPAAEFELWRHLMETKHRRQVTVDEVSVWVAETPDTWDLEIAAADEIGRASCRERVGMRVGDARFRQKR